MFQSLTFGRLNETPAVGVKASELLLEFKNCRRIPYRGYRGDEG